MKTTAPLSMFFGVALLGGVAVTQPRGDSALRGPYLGQDPPGITPVVFAPAVISRPELHEGCSGFMDEGRLFIFSPLVPGSDWKHKSTFSMQLREGRWTSPVPVPFNHLSPYNFTVAPDGTTLYFTSLRSASTPLRLMSRSNVWIVQFGDEGWSAPRMLGPDVNSEDYGENYPSVSSAGNIYFASDRPPCFGDGDIYMSENVEGVRSTPRNLGPLINTPYPEDDPFVAADESYLIFCSDRPDGLGLYDLYISFRTKDGGWTKSRNMGPEINTAGEEARPSVTPDGRFLFFTRGDVDPDWRDIFWVDARVLSQFAPPPSGEEAPAR